MKRRTFSTHLLKKITSTVLILSVFLGFAADTTEAHAPELLGEGGAMDGSSDPVLAPSVEQKLDELSARVQQLEADKNEILWLARAIRSESERTDEQRLIAWVIRNRVENNFRGSTYQEVVLANRQFSGLHKSDHNYARNISRNFATTEPAWITALEIAQEVYYAPDTERPLPSDVTHFYSPNVVAAPAWARGKAPVLKTTNGANYVRFAFYSEVR